jgi:hypothetical protein
MGKQHSEKTDSDIRVEYRKIDDHHIRVLTFRPELKEPVETIATLLPPVRGTKTTSEVKPRS